MSGIVTPDDPNRRERERVVAIDIETVADQEAVEHFSQDFESLDWPAHLKKMKRPELDDLATNLGMEPKLYKTMGAEADQILWLIGEVPDGELMPDAVIVAEAIYRDRQLSDFERKAALSPLTGKVCTVGVVSYYGDAEDPGADRTFAHAGTDEAKLLRAVVMAIEDADVITGFNFVDFDGPFLRTRMLVNDMVPPMTLWQFPRYRDRPIADTRMILGNWDRQARGTLKDWCWRFGLDLPPDTDWAVIRQWYEEENWPALEDHCLRDTRAAGDLYRVVNPILGLSPGGR